jgi:hypothetical protein
VASNNDGCEIFQLHDTGLRIRILGRLINHDHGIPKAARGLCGSRFFSKSGHSQPKHTRTSMS